MKHQYNELGRRLLAAIKSYQLGISMDYCLKRYIPEKVEEGWAELGENILSAIGQGTTTEEPGEGVKSRADVLRVQ
jgi:hypothetical protein